MAGTHSGDSDGKAAKCLLEMSKERTIKVRVD